VALVVLGSAVGLVVGVDWSTTSACQSCIIQRYLDIGWRHTVRSSAGASVGVVTKRVDVHATLGIGVVASDVVCDLSGGRLVLLLEGDGSLDVGVSTEDGDYTGCLLAFYSILHCVHLDTDGQELRISALRVSCTPF
jgi:hypothetical protein